MSRQSVLSFGMAAVFGILAVGSASAVTCYGKFATILGTHGSDVLYGTNGKDVIIGLAGDDLIHGRDGQDKICAGNGNDAVYSGRHRDFVDAGGQSDTVSNYGGRVTVWGSTGSDGIYSSGFVFNLLEGGGGSDFIQGLFAPTFANGGPGIDTCHIIVGSVQSCEIVIP